MFSVYDLYDLHAIYVAVRVKPENEVNPIVLKNCIKVIEERHQTCAFNQLRIALQPVCAMDENHLYDFALTENKYCYMPLSFLKDETIYMVLKNATEKLLSAVMEKDHDKIYALADCLHNLPIFIAEHRYRIPRKYWKYEVADYRRRWDRDFFKKEQKIIKAKERRALWIPSSYN